jgi:hypothetical protein
MQEHTDPLVMFTHDGAKLRIDSELNLTLDDEEADAEDVVEFLIKFAEDSMKVPDYGDNQALVDIVKEAAMAAELEEKKDD